MPTIRSSTQPVADTVLVKSVVLAVPPVPAFRLFSVPQLLESWLCTRANVEAAVGGPYELFWDPKDPENDSTIGCKVTAATPGRLLAFQWRSPRQFKFFANAADPLTHVVVAFHGNDQSTDITLVHSGWRSSSEWLQAAEWQSVAWDYAFLALAKAAGEAR